MAPGSSESWYWSQARVLSDRKRRMLTDFQRGGSCTIFLATLLLVCIGMTACGGSASSSKSTAASVRTARGGAPATLSQLHACLQRDGIAPAGMSHSSGVVDVVNGLRLPRGVTLARYEVALTKCRSAVDLGRTFHRPARNRGLSGSDAPRGSG
jgi:hypothetical protein